MTHQHQYFLFLDDFRNPEDCVTYMHRKIGAKNTIYLQDWTIARSYKEFVWMIEEKGLPSFVSFDHDLADDCYGREMSKECMEEFYKEDKREMTGYDCAKWLVRYCIARELNFPAYAIHSMNPVGAENIERVIQNFKMLPE